MVEDENGRIIKLEDRDLNQRRMVANTLLTPTFGSK